MKFNFLRYCSAYQPYYGNRSRRRKKIEFKPVVNLEMNGFSQAFFAQGTRQRSY